MLDEASSSCAADQEGPILLLWTPRRRTGTDIARKGQKSKKSTTELRKVRLMHQQGHERAHRPAGEGNEGLELVLGKCEGGRLNRLQVS